MRFRDVQHQDRALALLRRALTSGRTPHAYLFEGPEGVGKELTARALAARLMCGAEGLAPEADACGQCSSCRLLAHDSHPDFHLIHRGLHKVHPDRAIRARKGLFLAVDLIRHFLIEPAAMKPSQGRRRVFLIRDAERMNEEAQNALLKTLEEPPGTACLLLVTASAARLLPTIRSRCQSVPFGLLPAEFVAAELQSRAKLPAAEARALATLSDGRLGVALRWQALGLLELLPQVADALAGLSAGDPEAFSKGLIQMATDLATRSSPASSENGIGGGRRGRGVQNRRESGADGRAARRVKARAVADSGAAPRGAGRGERGGKTAELAGPAGDCGSPGGALYGRTPGSQHRGGPRGGTHARSKCRAATHGRMAGGRAARRAAGGVDLQNT